MFDTHKTRTIGLPRGEETMTICQPVFIKYRNVMDGQTELLYQYRTSVCWHTIKTVGLVGWLAPKCERQCPCLCKISAESIQQFRRCVQKQTSHRGSKPNIHPIPQGR